MYIIIILNIVNIIIIIIIIINIVNTIIIIANFSEVLHDVKDLIYIHPDASLYDAIKMLIHNKIHR